MTEMNLNEYSKGSFAVISEKGYQETMEQQVCPVLDRLRTVRVLHRDGSQKLYCEYYKNPEGDKGTILISHGFTESCGKYHEVIYYMLQKGYHVVMMEHRGHGRSRNDSEQDIPHIPTHVDYFKFYINDFRTVVTDVMEQELPGPYYLYAHSMGGCIAATYMEQFPQTFKKAVLSAPMFGIFTGGVPVEQMKAFVDMQCMTGHGRDFLTEQDYFCEEPNFADSASTCEPRYLYYFRQQLSHPEFQNGGASFGWIRESLNACEELLKPVNCARLATPVLLFQAELDTFVTPAEQEQLIRQIPDGTLVKVPGSKHEIYLADSSILEKYFSAIFEFLS